MQRTTSPDTTAIEMLDPAQACARLELDGRALLAMVNQGVLAAYDLGGHIRFKASDIATTARSFIAA